MKEIFIIITAVLLPLRLFSQGGVLSEDEYNDPWSFSSYNESGADDDERYEYLLMAPLGNSRNPFISLSEYNFSFVRYNRRSYDYRYEKIFISGIDIADDLTGNNLWNIASSAANLRQGMTSTYGLMTGAGTLGTIGGTRSYDIDAGSLSPEARAGFIITDRRFRYGMRFGIATGTLKNGWAFALSGTRRWGRDRHIAGVYADNWSANVSVSKKIGDRNNLSLTFITAPAEQGMRGAATREAFELTGDNLYNPYWGYQNGEVRNSRVRENKPSMLLASWNFDNNENLTLNTSIAFILSENSYSSLDWYDASNPMPDYYRYMPSFFANPDVAGDVGREWKNGNEGVTQVGWSGLYSANSGVSLPAAYIVSSRVTDMQKLQLASTFGYKAAPGIRINGGVRLKRDVASNYNRLDDLLGAEYIFDIDQFLIDDEYYGDKLENNLAGKGKRIGHGDKFGYSYDLHHDSYEAWALFDLGNSERITRLRGFAGAQTGYVTVYRDGHFEKELFEGSLSKGPSAKANFTTYMLKAGATYNFTPSHYAGVNVAYGDAAPLARNIFVSPDYQNALIDNPRTINMLSGELNYFYSNRILVLSISAYATLTSGESEVIHFYDDISSLYSNLVMSGIKKLFMGVELGIGVSITPRLTLDMAAAVTNNRYANNPMVKQVGDKNGLVIADNERAYIETFHLGGTPQRVASAELTYSGAKLWMASVSVNYAGDNYVDINPIRRMKRVCNRATSTEALAALDAQERFPEATTIDLFLSKTFRIGKHYLSVSGSVSNLASRKDIVYSGYEQMRLFKSGAGLNQSVMPFGSKYYYAYGRTYYLTLNSKF